MQSMLISLSERVTKLESLVEEVGSGDEFEDEPEDELDAKQNGKKRKIR
jgi:hypothetical protein